MPPAARGELEYAVVEEQQPQRQLEGAASQHDVQRFAGGWAGPGAWRLMMSRERAINNLRSR